MQGKLGDTRKLGQYADRAECDPDTFRARLHTAADNAAVLDTVVTRLAQAARRYGIRMASHDDPDIATRDAFHAHGCTVAEFPLTEAVAQAARAQGGDIVFGAPNVLRGRSHHGAPDATAMVAAPFRLAERGAATLPQAWALVSANPARAAGLADRGALAPGLRADAIIVDDRQPGLPRVVATVVGGRLRYATTQLATVAA
jgi:alpha-D-ribose 1-methylphosphonate 5-triphosphate diphosphatase